MRLLLAALLLNASAAQAAEPFPLVISPAPDRVAEEEDDWVRMVPTVGTSDAGGNDWCNSPAFHSQVTSSDGRYVYQMVCRWVTSDLIVKVDLQTGERTGVGAGNSLSIIRSGPYEGDLIVERHEYLGGEEGGSRDPAYVLKPTGETVLMVPNSDVEYSADAVDKWLSENGWNAW